ncbi:MAG: DUF3472 domain-containing protein [Magnetococcus sp. MYC-9]
MSPLPGILRLLLFLSALCGGVASVHALSLPYHSSRGDYAFPAEGPFYNLDMHLTWQEVGPPPSGLGYYAMFMFYFQNRAGGYTGLQWDGGGKKAIFSVWDQAGTLDSTVPEGSCKRFGHEGSGAQCIIPYPWVAGREYLLAVRVLNRTETGERWQSVVRDLTSGQETVIGRIELKDTPGYVGYGRLTGKGVNVLEYYGNAKIDDCRSLPVVALGWRGPFADERRLRAKEVHLAYSSRAECTNSNVASPGSGQLEQRAGGETRRLTVGGQRLQWPQIIMEEPP